LDFLSECLVGHPDAETVMRDYISLDGYKVLNCPYMAYKDGLGVDGSGVMIPVGVQYRIFEILQEMRKEGVKEKEFY